MNRLNNKITGHLACFTAYSIFGVNVVVCKNIANSAVLSPMGLFTIRAVVAATLFWAVSLFVRSEKVDRKDLPKIFVAAMLGMFVTQLSFLKAVTITTPFDISVMSTLTPVFTMFVAAVALKEPITPLKAGGVAVSFAGIMLLIFNSTHSDAGITSTNPWGIVLMLANTLSFALYLGIFRPLIEKYSVVTFMKWMFLFCAVLAVPFSVKELATLDYASVPPVYWAEVGFLVLFATFISYFLIPVGQKYLRPTIVGLYTYLQPLIAAGISICIGMDTLNWQKILAAVAVVGGVLMVSKSRARNVAVSGAGEAAGGDCNASCGNIGAGDEKNVNSK